MAGTPTHPICSLLTHKIVHNVSLIEVIFRKILVFNYKSKDPLIYFAYKF